MTDLPGNEIPPEALPEGGTNTPAQDAEFPPVWCRHDIRWQWNGTKGGWICDEDGHGDRDDEGEQIPVKTACAIEDGTVYQFQPSTNPAVWDVLCAQEAVIQGAALQARVDRLLGH
jgi:hypothetical protein